MTQEKPYVVQIDGGIGRVICSIPAIECLAEKGDVIVITSHPDVFLGNPHVCKVYNLNREYLWDDVIKHGIFLYPEPYFDHRYYNQEHHLIQSFNYLLNGTTSFSLPYLSLTEEEKRWGTDFIQGRKNEFSKEVVVFQGFGSTAKLEGHKVFDPTHRSLSLAKADQIFRSTDYLYINTSHIPLDYSNVWQQEFTLRQLMALTWACDFIVGIDSVVMHMGAVFDKKGVIFFGSTYQTNLAYPNFKNIQRDAYPKNYAPNRFSGFVDYNERALDFTEEEMLEIVSCINNKQF